MHEFYGGIEAGGTKFVCMVGSGPENIIDEKRFATAHPDETIPQVLGFFEPYARRSQLAAIGVASFGPLDLDPASPSYGYITTTAKPNWDQVDLRGRLLNGLGLPMAFDTDVNMAALGEQYWVAGNRSLDPFVYMTVGTGIGAGVLANGRPIHGLLHTEIGHSFVPHDRQKDPFPGVCPYHADCLEGLACGPAMARRWGQPAESLPDDHPAWDLEAGYIALALANLVCSCSPQRIVLGGGVPEHAGFHALVRRKVKQYLNGYIRAPMLIDRMDDYIVPPALANRSGGLGAIAAAMQLVDERNRQV